MKKIKIKCEKCNGNGFISLGKGIRGMKKCEFCNGTGEVQMKCGECEFCKRYEIVDGHPYNFCKKLNCSFSDGEGMPVTYRDCIYK